MKDLHPVRRLAEMIERVRELGHLIDDRLEKQLRARRIQLPDRWYSGRFGSESPADQRLTIKVASIRAVFEADLQQLQAAASDASDLAQGIGALLEFGMEKSGQFETRLRKRLDEVGIDNAEWMTCVRRNDLWIVLMDLSEIVDELRIVALAPTKTKPGSPDPNLTLNMDDEFRPMNWFRKGAASRIRMAAGKNRKTKRVASKRIDGVVCYRVGDVRQWFPNDMPVMPGA